MPSTSNEQRILLDAGVLIGALMRGDPRHAEARPLVDAARTGALPAATTTGILSEVYAALTWQGALPPQSPEAAAHAVRLLVQPPSALVILAECAAASLLMLDLARDHKLTARRIHDARHAATAMAVGVSQVYTYDVHDWSLFIPDGMRVVGPPSVLAR